MSEIEDLRRDVIELRDWKEAVLGKCQASSGWNDLKWGGYKDGWGFVHYFIGHLNTRALEAEADLATPTVAQASGKSEAEKALQYHYGTPDRYVSSEPAVAQAVPDCGINHAELRANIIKHCAGIAETIAKKHRYSDGHATFQSLAIDEVTKTIQGFAEALAIPSAEGGPAA